LAAFLRSLQFATIEVVGYVRAPAAYITSLAQQRLRSGALAKEAPTRGGTARRGVLGRLLHGDLSRAFCHYERSFQKFDDVFGRENVHLWKFDPGSFPVNCVVTDFCKKVGVALPADRIVRVNESLSREGFGLLYTYCKLGPELGFPAPGSGQNKRLLEHLAKIGSTKFRFAPDTMRAALESDRADIAWMEARLGESLQEDLGERRPGDISDESDLLRPDPQAVDKLLKLLGRAAPTGVKGETPEEVAVLVHALRRCSGLSPAAFRSIKLSRKGGGGAAARADRQGHGRSPADEKPVTAAAQNSVPSSDGAGAVVRKVMNAIKQTLGPTDGRGPDTEVRKEPAPQLPAVLGIEGELTTTVLRNVTLWPLLHGSNQSNLKYPLSSEFRPSFDHLRINRDQVLNSSSYEEPGDAPDAPFVSGTRLYGGVIFPAFGHFIAESIHRLWPLYTDPQLAKACVVFHAARDPSLAMKDFPPWMNEIFGLLRLDPDRITMIDQPMTFEELVVPVQGSLLGLGPITDRYRTFFPPSGQAHRPGTASRRAQRVYVSRSKHAFSGSYLGEPLVERILAEAGFEILHPQEHSIRDVISKLEASETAVFAEGSAIHFLELCRRPPSRVFVICRRPHAAGFYFENLVRGASEKAAFHPIKAALPALDWLPRRGQAAGQNASAVIDVQRLVKELAEFCGVKLREPDEREIREAQALSLIQIILDPRSTRAHTSPERLGTLLTELKRQVSELDILPWRLERGAVAKRRIRAGSRNPQGAANVRRRESAAAGGGRASPLRRS
jgi:hypothetical protein